MNRTRWIPLSALLLSGLGAAWAQTAPEAQNAATTPPMAPNVRETPLPPPVTLPPPTTPDADAPSRPLTADEAARIALLRQPDVTVARALAEAAEGRTQTARAGLRPTVGVGAGYSRVESISGSGGGGTTGGGAGGSTVTAAGYQASANARQLLFDFNNTRERVRQAGAAERAAEQNLTRVQADLVLQVKRAFYDFVQQTRLVEANEANVANRQGQLELARARLDSGLGLPSDVVRAETGVAEAVLGLQTARNNAMLARIALAQRMGLDPRTPIEAADAGEPDPGAVDVDALVQRAMQVRPEARQAEAARQAAEHGIRAARTDNAPSIAANLGVATRDRDFPPRNSNLSVGVSVQWNLLDAGATAGRVRSAEADARAAGADVEAVRLMVTADVSAAYLNLRTAEQRVETATAQVANAEEGVRLAEGRYRSGLGTFLEVTDAQTELLAARVNRVNAETGVDTARAALARAIGAGLP